MGNRTSEGTAHGYHGSRNRGTTWVRGSVVAAGTPAMRVGRAGSGALGGSDGRVGLVHVGIPRASLQQIGLRGSRLDRRSAGKQHPAPVLGGRVAFVLLKSF